MNQPSPGFGVAGDNYPGVGQKGGTVPGGPPEQIQSFEGAGFTQLAVDGQPYVPGNPTGFVNPTFPDTYQTSVGQPPFAGPVGGGPAPYPAVQPLPSMAYGAGTARPKKSGMPMFLLVGGGLAAVLLLVIGVGVVLLARSSSSDETAESSVMTFAPVATVEPEYVAPAITPETSQTSAYVAPEPSVAPPPAKTVKPKPTATASATSTSTAVASATPTETGSVRGKRIPVSVVHPELRPGALPRLRQSAGDTENTGSSTEGAASSSGSDSSGRGRPIRVPVHTN